MAEATDLISSLRATMGKLEIALSSISDAMGWTGAEGKVQWCNSALARLAGKSHLEVLGAGLADLLPLGALTAEGHGAEADFGDIQAGTAHLAIFHDKDSYRT